MSTSAPTKRRSDSSKTSDKAGSSSTTDTPISFYVLMGLLAVGLLYALVMLLMLL